MTLAAAIVLEISLPSKEENALIREYYFSGRPTCENGMSQTMYKNTFTATLHQELELVKQGTCDSLARLWAPLCGQMPHYSIKLSYENVNKML